VISSQIIGSASVGSAPLRLALWQYIYSFNVNFVVFYISTLIFHKLIRYELFGYNGFILTL